MTQLQSGYTAQLQVVQELGSRWELSNGEETVMLNASEVTETVTVGDAVTVFLYRNRRGTLAATMQVPKVTCSTYGWGRVIRVEKQNGVYVDVGSSFEVLIDRSDLPKIFTLWPAVDDELLMTLRTDQAGNIFGRLITEQQMEQQRSHAAPALFNQNMQARAYRLLPVGSFFVSIPDHYRIFVHHTERQEEPRLGQLMDVRIIEVHDDGTLNGSLLPRVEERLATDALKVYDYLQQVGGKMPFDDRSSPEEIREMFQMSKSAFKRALGMLMKEQKVKQQNGWTYLIEV